MGLLCHFWNPKTRIFIEIIGKIGWLLNGKAVEYGDMLAWYGCGTVHQAGIHWDSVAFPTQFWGSKPTSMIFSKALALDMSFFVVRSLSVSVTAFCCLTLSFLSEILRNSCCPANTCHHYWKGHASLTLFGRPWGLPPSPNGERKLWSMRIVKVCFQVVPRLEVEMRYPLYVWIRLNWTFVQSTA